MGVNLQRTTNGDKTICILSVTAFVVYGIYVVIIELLEEDSYCKRPSSVSTILVPSDGGLLMKSDKFRFVRSRAFCTTEDRKQAV